MLKVFKEHCVNFCEKKDSNRIQLMEKKVTPACKQRWQQLRTKQKGYGDADEEREGVTYGPGMFWMIKEQENFIINSIVISRLYTHIDVIKTYFPFWTNIDWMCRIANTSHVEFRLNHDVMLRCNILNYRLQY